MITNVEAKCHNTPDSDHLPLVATVRIKLTPPKPPSDSTRTHFTHPKEGHNAEYNQIFNDYFMNIPTHEITWENLHDTLIEAADKAYPKQQTKPRKDYISTDTWALIQQRQALNTQLLKQTTTNTTDDTLEQIATLRKQIRKEARKDRDTYMANKVHEELDLRDRWFGVKML